MGKPFLSQCRPSARRYVQVKPGGVAFFLNDPGVSIASARRYVQVKLPPPVCPLLNHVYLMVVPRGAMRGGTWMRLDF